MIQLVWRIMQIWKHVIHCSKWHCRSLIWHAIQNQKKQSMAANNIDSKRQTIGWVKKVQPKKKKKTKLKDKKSVWKNLQYTKNEVDILLEIVKGMTPIGLMEWDIVTEKYGKQCPIPV